VVIWALKQDKLYASPSFDMLKVLVQTIELHFNRENLSLIEKIRALLEALYQVYETDPLNVTHSLRYQSTITRLNFSHQFSCQIKDAVQKFIDALLNIFEGSYDPRKRFLRPSMQPAYHIVSR